MTAHQGTVGDLRRMLLQLNEQVKPMHEWLEGQHVYFITQGYTESQSRAMAAAEFVIIFGPSTMTQSQKSDGE